MSPHKQETHSIHLERKEPWAVRMGTSSSLLARRRLEGRSQAGESLYPEALGEVCPTGLTLSYHVCCCLSIRCSSFCQATSTTSAMSPQVLGEGMQRQGALNRLKILPEPTGLGADLKGTIWGRHPPAEEGALRKRKESGGRPGSHLQPRYLSRFPPL